MTRPYNERPPYKTETFIEGGIEFTLSTWMMSKRKEVVDYVFRKMMERLEDEFCRSYGEEPR